MNIKEARELSDIANVKSDNLVECYIRQTALEGRYGFHFGGNDSIMDEIVSYGRENGFKVSDQRPIQDIVWIKWK